MGRIVALRASGLLPLFMVASLSAGCHSLHKQPVSQLPPPVALSNADVISMSANGLPDDTIIRSIQSQPNVFDVTPAALIDLKANGVSDRVMQAMQSGPPQPAIVVAEPPPVVVEPSVHFGVPFFVGRPWHHHHYHRRHHHHEPRFSMSFWHGW